MALSEEDRLLLLRLTQQVSSIAGRLEAVESHLETHAATVPEKQSFRRSNRDLVREEDFELGRARLDRPKFPDSQKIRRMILQRQLRARFFDGDLFADPAWDMLLDLTVAHVEHHRVSVTSLTIASGVPTTSALRWIGQMIAADFFERHEDENDRRRAFITLTPKALDAMARYFEEIDNLA